MSALNSCPTSWRSAFWCRRSSNAIRRWRHPQPLSRHPRRFKDYISTPKPNQYQSLHTGIMGPERQRIEIQIRTQDMHEVAELGVAAHWGYKAGAPRTDGLQYRWLRELLDIVEHAQKPEEFLENTKLELFQDQVFCFSPKGDLIALPRGATPVDFAYAVHSRVGDACTGPRSTGAWCRCARPYATATRSRSSRKKAARQARPGNVFVVTGKAKSCIRRFIRTQQRTEYVLLGKSMLEKLCKQEGVDYSEKAFEAIAKNYQSASMEDLLANIGASLQPLREVFNAAYPQHHIKPPEKADRTPSLKPKISTKTNAPLTLKGLIPGMAVHYARCCHPLPGDPIVASSPPARASPFTRRIAKRWKASPGRPNAGSMSAGATIRIRATA